MKRWQTIVMSLASGVCTLGMFAYFGAFFLAMGSTPDDAFPLFVLLPWLLSFLTIPVLLVAGVMALVRLYNRNRATPMPEGRPHLPPTGQVVFAALVLYFGNFLPSCVLALHALDHALAAKAEPTTEGAQARLRKARNLNIAGAVGIGVLYLGMAATMIAGMLLSAPFD